jgi:pimeloyl-ACP methyl ester carboxylesterase
MQAVPRSRRTACVLALVLVAACAAPVRVRRADPEWVQRDLTRSILTGNEVSPQTHYQLHRFGLADEFKKRPAQVLADIHRHIATSDDVGPDVVFAAAELSFAYGQRTKQPADFLAAGVYAYAFLFPDEFVQRPFRFDPRVRIAADIYNRAFTRGFYALDGKHVAIASGVYPLPWGQLEVVVAPDAFAWGERQLVDFLPAAELEVKGLTERYRRSGIGVPLAAATKPIEGSKEPQDFISPMTRVPVSAVLTIAKPTAEIRAGRVRADLRLYDGQVTETVRIADRDIPLEVEPTAALAYQLSQSRFWDLELSSFFGKSVFGGEPTRLVAVQPYRRGRIPVVFVHGTASSPGRWADMVNDLSNDPDIREHFQFWYFTYDSGNPIFFTADALRESLKKTVARLDPEGTDPGLRRMVVIGHSQGGLLTKTTAIDSGDRFYRWKVPFEQLQLKPETREYFQRVVYLKPLPFVRRVIFIATPHRGSYIAGNWLAHYVASFIKMPARVMDASTELIKGNPEFANFRLPSAVDNMTPNNPFVKTMQDIPVAPGVASHSIVAVKTGGPPWDDGDDGVVKYKSAHRTDVDSEIVVDSPHSCQSKPATVAEVRRILRLHLAEASRGS